MRMYDLRDILLHNIGARTWLSLSSEESVKYSVAPIFSRKEADELEHLHMLTWSMNRILQS